MLGLLRFLLCLLDAVNVLESLFILIIRALFHSIFRQHRLILHLMRGFILKHLKADISPGIAHFADHQQGGCREVSLVDEAHLKESSDKSYDSGNAFISLHGPEQEPKVVVHASLAVRLQHKFIQRSVEAIGESADWGLGVVGILGVD